MLLSQDIKKSLEVDKLTLTSIWLENGSLTTSSSLGTFLRLSL